MAKYSPIIIDADTGIDDSMALVLAAYMKEVDIKLVVGSTGNCSSKQASINNINILQCIDRENIPVAQGMEHPMGEKTLNVAAHGKTGLGEFVFEKPNKKAQKGDIADIIHSVAMETDELISIICLGSATNIAYYFQKYPKDIDQIDRIYFSGGLLEKTKKDELPYMGFNVGFDPKAMEELLKTNVQVTICPSDMGHLSYFTWEDVINIKNTNKTGNMFFEIFKFYHDRHIKNGIANHDLCAFMSYSHPELFKFKNAAVNVKYYSNLPTGVLNIDFSKPSKRFTVATSVNSKKIKRVFMKYLKRMP